jgi:hypothetical protein
MNGTELLVAPFHTNLSIIASRSSREKVIIVHQSRVSFIGRCDYYPAESVPIGLTALKEE